MPADPVFLSRHGKTHPLGKMTAEIPKLKVPEETKETLEQLSREAGMTLSEFCKSVLMVRAHGVDMMLRLERERLTVVAGMGKDEGE